MAIYFIHDDVDSIFEEKGNCFASIRKLQWAKEGSEPDPEKAKLEVRKWYVTPEGETPGKGYTFMTGEGPDSLIESLLKLGYGNTTEVLKIIKERDNFKESVMAIHFIEDDTKTEDGEFFDARKALLA